MFVTLYCSVASKYTYEHQVLDARVQVIEKQKCNRRITAHVKTFD